MLLKEDKRKIENYVDELIDDLKKDTAKAKHSGMSGEQLIKKVTSMTVNKITPESKMIMSSVYKIMKTHTLEENYFSDSKHKAAFYSADILKKLTRKFDFDVPNEIKLEKDNTTVTNLTASGAVVIVGGIISITLNSWIPVCAAAIIGGIMAFLLKNKDESSTNDNIDSTINKYYDTVKKSLLSWVNSVESYYDKEIDEIKERG